MKDLRDLKGGRPKGHRSRPLVPRHPCSCRAGREHPIFIIIDFHLESGSSHFQPDWLIYPEPDLLIFPELARLRSKVFGLPRQVAFWRAREVGDDREATARAK